MRYEYIEAGQIVTTHGVRGEMKVLPWLDSPDDLKPYHRCRIEDRVYAIVACRVQKTSCLIKLGGIDTVEKAQLLRGKTLEIFREDAPTDVVFASELVNMNVYADDVCIGQISDVLDYPGNQVYVVTGEREYLIPAVREFVLSLCMEENRMDVKLLKGMASDED